MGFFRLVFAFLSIRSFHAVRSAPISTSSLAAARRICVCPIFPQPPGIGRKISGRLLHKRRLLLQRKHQISVPPCLRGQRSKFPASYTKSRQSCVGVLFHPLQAQCNPAKICCGHRATPIRQKVSDHHRMACVYCSGGTSARACVSSLTSELPTTRPVCSALGD